MLREQTFGDRLILLIRREGLRNKDVAAVLGVTGQSVGKWIAGGEVCQGNLEKLARFFDVSWVWLRYGEKAYASVCDKRAKDVVAVERRKWMREIELREIRYRTGLELAGVGSWEWWPSDDRALCSDRHLEIFGIDRDGFRGYFDEFVGCLSGGDAKVIHEKLMDCFLGRTITYDYTHRVITTGGRAKWVRCQGTRCVAGDEPSVVGITFDVTQSLNYRAAMDGCGHDREIYIFDKYVCRFTDANEAALKNTQYTIEEILDLSPFSLGSDAGADMFGIYIERASLGTSGIEFEAEHVRKDGSVYPVRVNLKCVSHDRNGGGLFISTCEDLSAGEKVN